MRQPNCEQLAVSTPPPAFKHRAKLKPDFNLAESLRFHFAKSVRPTLGELARRGLVFNRLSLVKSGTSLRASPVARLLKLTVLEKSFR